VSPFFLAASIVFRHVSIVHINTSLNRKAYWRDLVYLFVSKALGARVVYQVHGGELPRKFFANRPALTSFLRRTLRMPDLVVVLAQIELNAYKEFVPRQQVVALPNGIDCRPFSAVPTVRSDPTHPLQIVYVGRIARRRGSTRRCRGLRLAQELGVDARLVIGGSGAESSGCGAMRRRSGSRIAWCSSDPCSATTR
jgi:glycosyltransferase involved in cell wall biosynthesis